MDAGVNLLWCNYLKRRHASHFSNYKQLGFINFVLDKYVEEGVAELSTTKMRGLLELKYNTISDAARELGTTTYIRETFIGFQKHLYER